MTQKGIITRLQNKRGFGFITVSNGESIFFSKKCIEGPFDENTLIGQEVTFNLGSNHRGKCAQNISLNEVYLMEPIVDSGVTKEKVNKPQPLDLVKVQVLNSALLTWYRLKILVAKTGFLVARALDMSATKLKIVSKVLLNAKHPQPRKTD